jgi:membrane peptidoglycan carboxypeptidase
VARRTDGFGDEQPLGPRHGADDGAGRRALEAYAEYEGLPPAPPPRKRFIDYPRAGRRRWTRWLPSWRLVTSTFLLGVAVVTGAILYGYMTTQLPARENTGADFRTTIVYYADGKTEIGRFAAQNRVFVPLENIPKTVQEAVLSAEDRTFETNGGVSVSGVLRAAINNLRGGATQGGSTITQQYVKNAYSDATDRSYTRKLHEFFISLKAARELSKDQILERYLNIIYFGRGCYGIEAASEGYFGKHVKQLTPSEAAYLAGIINGPSLYNSGTAYAKAAAHDRWTYVLDGMVTQGWLPADVRAKQKFPKIKPVSSQAKPVADDQRDYMMGMVRTEALKLGISESQLQQNGYRITTTFQPGMIADAKTAIASELGPRRKWPTGTQVAIATIDAKTGSLVSMYAGDGVRDRNAVTQDNMQAGSTFKPFALVAGLEGKRGPGDCSPKSPDADSVSLKSRFNGNPGKIYPGFPKGVTNFETTRFGMVDLVKATEESINAVYVALNDQVDPHHTEDVAICAGYPKNTVGLTDNLANVLGTSSPHPVDIAQAYATFAAQGVRHDWFVISKITDSTTGAVVKQHDVQASSQQVFDKGVMADATYAMQAVVEHGTAYTVSRLGRPVAGKTGTTDLNKSALFAGYTPQYATVVAMYKIGKDGRQEELVPWAGAGSQVTGGTLPARVWTAYMGKVLDGVPPADFPEPVFGGQPVNAAPVPSAAPSAAPTITTQPAPSPTRPAPSPTAPPSPTPTEPTPTATEPTPTFSGRPTPSLPGPTLPRPSRSRGQ